MLKKAWPWLRLLLAAGLLGVLVWRLGTGAFLDGLRVLDAPAVLAALGIGLLTTVCSAGRWVLIARRLGLRLRLGEAVPDYYRALLLNAVLPAGVLGDVHRAVSHGQRSGDLGRGVRAVVLERFAGQVALIGLAVVVVPADPALAGMLSPGTALLALLGGVVVLGGALAAWTRWGRGGAALRGAVLRTLADARAGLWGRRTLPGVTVLSLVTLAGHVCLYLVAARTAGVAAPAWQLVPLIVLALLVMGLPVNIGGYGPREAFSAVAFGAAGLGAAAGVTTAVVYGVLALIAALPGVLTPFLRRSAEQLEVPGEPGNERREHPLALTGVGERRAADHPGSGVAPESRREQVAAIAGNGVRVLPSRPHEFGMGVQQDRGFQLARVHVLVRGRLASGRDAGVVPVGERGEQCHAATALLRYVR